MSSSLVKEKNLEFLGLWERETVKILKKELKDLPFRLRLKGSKNGDIEIDGNTVGIPIELKLYSSEFGLRDEWLEKLRDGLDKVINEIKKAFMGGE